MIQMVVCGDSGLMQKIPWWQIMLLLTVMMETELLTEGLERSLEGMVKSSLFEISPRIAKTLLWVYLMIDRGFFLPFLSFIV
jgi:hypothetical protein